MFTGTTKRMPIPRACSFVVIFLLSAPLSAYSPAYPAMVSPHAVASLPVVFSFAQTNPLSVSKGNPASVYCTRVGGIVTMNTRGDGRAYGMCRFTDNRACEEWALFRGHCPLGGVRVTGFDTIAQEYCAWLGGETLAVPHATCTLPSGKVCDDDALYNGMCDDPGSEAALRLPGS